MEMNMSGLTNRTRSSRAQLSYLANFMQSNRELARGVTSTTPLEVQLEMEKEWKKLAKQLNSLEGPTKSILKWKQAWRDLRNNERKKMIKNAKKYLVQESTVNEEPAVIALTKLEDLLETDPVAVFQLDDAPTISTMYSSNPTVPPSPASREAIPYECSSESLSSEQPDPESRKSQTSQSRKRSWAPVNQDNFDNKILELEFKKLQVLKETNSIKNRKNDILERIAGALEVISDKLNYSSNGT